MAMPSAGQVVEQQELSFIADRDAKGTLWKTFWSFLTKLNIFLPSDPAITFLDMYPNKFKTYDHINTCKWVFIATLGISENTLKQKDIVQQVNG